MKNRIGIVGGGQLGRMLSFYAKRLGFVVHVTDPSPHSPAGQVCDGEITADYNDEKAIRQLAKISDYLTFEIELVNAQLLDELAENGLKINPSPKTLTIIKDKLLQKQFLKKNSIPVADFVELKTETENVSGKRGTSESRINNVADSGQARMTIREEIKSIVRNFGYPFLLKARFDAYDGRGNALIQKESDIEEGLQKLRGRKLYVEKFVPFVKELAVMAARDMKGNIALYPVVETVHKNNILHIVYTPAPIKKTVYNKAGEFSKEVMQHLHGAGVFGIEMFLTKDGEVLVNEIAPRVHNSGHYTIEACVASQFEQHIRAITGLPLGSTEMLVPAAVMINILGDRKGKAEVTGLEKALAIPNVSVHIYGKAETKPERKMGHITAVGKSIDEVYNKAKLARGYINT